jgi:hypothetical protein
MRDGAERGPWRSVKVKVDVLVGDCYSSHLLQLFLYVLRYMFVVVRQHTNSYRMTSAH